MSFEALLIIGVVLFYGSATIIQGLGAIRPELPAASMQVSFAVAVMGFICHSLLIWQQSLQPGFMQTFYSPVFSAFLLGCMGMVLLYSFFYSRALRLLLFLGPVVCVSVFLQFIFGSRLLGHSGNWSLNFHIIVSLLAFGLIILASLQAACLLVMEWRLKKHQISGFTNWLPPLQTQERIIRHSSRAGGILLLLTLLSGLLFVGELFPVSPASRLILVFSILGLGFLLWVGFRHGSRSVFPTFSWTVSGFLLLLLAYISHRLFA